MTRAHVSEFEIVAVSLQLCRRVCSFSILHWSCALPSQSVRATQICAKSSNDDVARQIPRAGLEFAACSILYVLFSFSILLRNPRSSTCAFNCLRFVPLSAWCQDPAIVLWYDIMRLSLYSSFINFIVGDFRLRALFG